MSPVILNDAWTINLKDIMENDMEQTTKQLLNLKKIYEDKKEDEKLLKDRLEFYLVDTMKRYTKHYDEIQLIECKLKQLNRIIENPDDDEPCDDDCEEGC